MFHLVAPAGSPIKFAELFRILGLRTKAASDSESFRNMILQQTGARHCWLVNSGRTALATSLQVMKSIRGPEKDEIVIPAYTCFSVAAAAVRAGLRIRPVDVDPVTMDYDYRQLAAHDLSRTVAVTACNLFGIVSDWDMLRTAVGEFEVYLIDDAAQTMGATYDGQASGTLGDVGFYSLDRGKSLSTWSGGVLLTSNEELAARLNETVAGLPTPGRGQELAVLAKLAAYSLLLRPALYWLPDRLPFLGLGRTVFDPSFSQSRLSLLQSVAGSVLLGKLHDLNEARTVKAMKALEPLVATGKYVIPGSDRTPLPAYPRLPVLAQDALHRDRALMSLRRAGIKATGMYPSTIGQIPGITPHLVSDSSNLPGAEDVVKRLFTLPTHEYVNDAYIETIVRVLTGL